MDLRLWHLVVLLLVVFSLLVAQEGVIGQSPPERPIEERLDMTRVLLERATQDYDRCKNDLADLWVQARKLSLDYQQVVKERDALKPAAPKEPPPVSPTN